MSYTMHRTSSLALLSLVLTFCPGATSKAGSIVYNIQNYADLQNGYSLSGTITTDGTIGTLTSADITAFSISVTGPTDYDVTSGSVGVQGVTATAAAITIAPAVVGGNANFLNLGSDESVLQYLHFSDLGAYIFGAEDSLPQAWNTDGDGLSLGGSTWIIATANTSAVPEPATLTLALFSVACFVVVETRRKASAANPLRRSD